jgi:hypothetical protein
MTPFGTAICALGGPVTCAVGDPPPGRRHASRASLDQHATYIVAAYLAGATR